MSIYFWPSSTRYLWASVEVLSFTSSSWFTVGLFESGWKFIQLTELFILRQAERLVRTEMFCSGPLPAGHYSLDHQKLISITCSQILKQYACLLTLDRCVSHLGGGFRLGANCVQTCFLLYGTSGPVELPRESRSLLRLSFLKPQRKVEQESRGRYQSCSPCRRARPPLL